MNYSPYFINPYKTVIGRALLFDLSDSFQAIHKNIFLYLTNEVVLASLFACGILLAYIIKVNIEELMLSLLRAIVLLSLLPLLTFSSLEIGCGVGDLLILPNNFLLTKITDSKNEIIKSDNEIKQPSQMNVNGWVNRLKQKVDQGVIEKLNSFRKGFSTTSLKLILNLVLVFLAVSFSVYYFLFCCLGYIQVILSILPIYEHLWKGVFKTFGFALVFPMVIVIMTNFLSIIASKEIIEETSIRGVVMAIVFLFLIFSSFKISKSLVDGMGAGDTAGHVGISYARSLGTAAFMKTLNTGLMPVRGGLSLAGSFLSDKASHINETKPPTSVSPFSGDLTLKEKMLRAGNLAMNPKQEIMGMAKRAVISRQAKKANLVDQEERIPMSRPFMARVSPNTSTELFDHVVANGRDMKAGTDYYVHDKANWNALNSKTQQIMKSNYAHRGEQFEQGKVYYKEPSLSPNPKYIHDNTVKALDNVREYLPRLDDPTKRGALSTKNDQKIENIKSSITNQPKKDLKEGKIDV